MANLYRKPVVVTDRKTGEMIKTPSKKRWGQCEGRRGSPARHPPSKFESKEMPRRMADTANTHTANSHRKLTFALRRFIPLGEIQGFFPFIPRLLIDIQWPIAVILMDRFPVGSRQIGTQAARRVTRPVSGVAAPKPLARGKSHAEILRLPL